MDLDLILKQVEEAKTARKKAMPTEKEALVIMHQAYLRLHELGFRDSCYCPKDGKIFEVIEAGSTGIHDCYYEGEWPEGNYWLPDEGDVWPSRPILFRKKEKTNANNNCSM